MEKDVRIRRSQPQDAEALQKLMHEYITLFYEQTEPDPKQTAEVIKRLMEDEAFGVQFVAETDDGLAGFATLYVSFSTLKMKPQAIMNDLYVTADMRGGKVGEKLFTACVDFVRDGDYASLVWETAADNEPAQAFYAKMGGALSEWLHYEIS
ncbi:GNAT family N-acetyltransferase [Bacillus daqingensis]|uniref:GNAT family N-acetyltransferase n=1 Tax=Bacillus daqingensis TaxID=872396 RepID=A0ABV9NV77_9BACI